MLNNEIIIFPTDTIYGIGAKINSQIGLQKIYQIKKRKIDKPISVLFSSWEQLKNIIIIEPRWKRVVSFFWPGPLTVIVWTKLSFYQQTKEKKIGIRIPNHPLALAILKKEGPLRVTSVNISGEKPLNNYQMIRRKYDSQVDFIYDENKYKNFSSCLASTVIDITTNNWHVIRSGFVNLAMLEKKKKIFEKYYF